MTHKKVQSGRRGGGGEDKLNNNLMTKDLEAQKSASTCESCICESVNPCADVFLCV